MITVGGLNATLDRAWDQQDHGPTLDGRGKPELLGNAAVDSVSTTANWRSGFLAGAGFNGTSFAAPFVTGAVAQMLDFGKTTGQNTDHRVIKAIVSNSGVKSLDSNGNPWSNSPTQPLDDEQGTGILNIPRIHAMYSAGEQDDGGVAMPGYDFARVESTDTAGGGRKVYSLGSPDAGADLNVTLTWDRHTFWNDANGNQSIDAADSFYVDPLDAQDNLDLIVFRDGVQIASSISTVDTVEYLHLTSLVPGDYELHVLRREVANSGSDEEYAVAWDSSATWTPTRDYGDAPASYETDSGDAASHLASGPRLGPQRDAEIDGLPSPNADGDNADGVNDEDGVVFGALTAGGDMAALNVLLQNAAIAKVDAWIDFNRDGDWGDAGEKILSNVDVTEAMQTLNFQVPAGISPGDTFARVRLSTDGVSQPSGPAADGEVEDYRITIAPPPRVESIVVNHGQAQRSSVNSLTVTFDRIVEIDESNSDVFEITNIDANQIAGYQHQIFTNNGRTVVELTFVQGPTVAPFGSLLDGNYQLLINADRVSFMGAKLDGNADGSGGDDHQFGTQAADAFYRKYGDTDGNRLVNLLDFAVFRAGYQSMQGQVGFEPGLDADGNQKIDLSDFAYFRANYG